jgi:hypothetical protein
VHTENVENTCRGELVNEGRRNLYEAGEKRVMRNLTKGIHLIH